MASSIPAQTRAVDPFASFNSDTVNKLTRMITNGSDGLTTKDGLDVISDSTSPTTTVIVNTGSVYMDDVLITITDEFSVDFTDSNNYIAFGSGFDESGWYEILLEYQYVKSRPAPTALIKILKPSQVPSASLGTSLLFLKAVYVAGAGPHYIDTTTTFLDYDPNDPTIKREYTDLYFGVETTLPTHDGTTDIGRVVYETSTDAFWFGYSNRWGKISAGVEVTLNTDTTGVAVGSLCFTNSSGDAELAYAFTVDTGAEMVVVEVGLAINNTGRAIMSGFVEDVPVQTGIIINIGDILYLSDTEPGKVTNVRTVPVRQVVGRAITGGNSTIPIGILFFPRDVHSLAISGTINPGDWVSEGGGLYSETINITPLDVDSTHPTVIVNVWDDADDKKISPYEVEIISAGNGIKIYTDDNSLTWNYIISSGGGSVGSVPSGGTNDHSLLLGLDYASSGHTGFAPSPHGNAAHSATFIEAAGVTFANMNANGDVGAGAAQVAQGNHTHTGLIDVPSGEIILFEKDTAVTGYSLLVTDDDSIIYITKGSGAGGEVGGTAKAGGTWSQPNHNHPFTSTHTHTSGAHTHTVDITANNKGTVINSNGYNVFGTGSGSNSWFYVGNVGNSIGKREVTSSGSGSTGNGTASGNTSGNATSNAWRPQGRNYTRQQRI